MLNNIDPQVLKPFGNSLLMIAAMTYAKNQADISTMASLEVGLSLDLYTICMGGSSFIPGVIRIVQQQFGILPIRDLLRILFYLVVL